MGFPELVCVSPRLGVSLQASARLLSIASLAVAMAVGHGAYYDAGCGHDLPYACQAVAHTLMGLPVPPADVGANVGADVGGCVDVGASGGGVLSVQR